MSQTNDSSIGSENEQHLDDIIAEYIFAEESGQAVSREELLEQHPELSKDLAEFFADRDRFKRLASPLSPEASRHNDLPTTVRYFGDYELLEEIAQGGMGVVYKARQTSLNRIVAVKMILSGHLASDDDVKRFTDEAETAASLRHKAIVPIHEVGMQKGQRYFSMDYIEGQNLAELIRTDPPAPDEAARIVKAIAEAVDYAHQQGTVHRDIKPSNILMDDHGQVHITDFGLAMRVEGDSELTRTGQVLGTPSYMSPEQAQAKHNLVGPATDIYSLGAILYELLAGRPPFRAESAVDTIQQVIEKDPIPPTRLNRETPRDLETICLMCLDKEPHKRYGRAALLADDLGCYLAGEPILARPVGQVERVWRWCKRQPVVAALSAAVVVVLLAGTLVSMYFALEEHRQAGLAQKKEGEAIDARNAESEAKKSAQESAEESRQRLSHQYVANGVALMNQGDLPASLTWFVEALKIDQEDPGREATHRMRIDTVLRRCPQPVRMWFGKSRIVSADLSPDGGRVVWTDGGAVVHIHDIARNKLLNSCRVPDTMDILRVIFTHDGTQVVAVGLGATRLCLFDTTSGEVTSTSDGAVFSENPIQEMHVSPSGLVSLSGAETEDVWLLDPSRGLEVVGRLSHPAYVRHCDFSSDGSILGAACGDGSFHIWDVASQSRHAEPLKLGNMLSHVAFSQRGRHIATCGRDVHLLDVDAGNQISLSHGQPVYSVEFSPNGKLLASSCRGGIVRTWDVESGELKLQLPHQNDVYHLQFSSDGELLLAGNIHGSIRIWNTSDGSPACSPMKHAGGITFAKFVSDSRFVLTTSTDASIRVWQIDEPAINANVTFRSAVRDIDVSPDGTQVATVSNNRNVEIWDMENGARRILLHDAAVQDVEFSPDGQLIATAASDWKGRIWDVSTAELVHTLEHDSYRGQPEHWFLDRHSVSFSPEGDRVLTTMGCRELNNGEVISWDVKSGKPLTHPLTLDTLVNFARFCPEGDRILAGCGLIWVGEGTVVIWDASTGQRLEPLPHKYTVNHFAFSGDSRTLITVGGALDIHRGGLGRVTRWNWRKRKKLESTHVHSDFVEHVEVGPSGKHFVTASHDGTARVWDVETGQPISPALEVNGRVTDARFSPIERYVITSSVNSSHTPTAGLRIWDWRTGQPVSPPLTSDRNVQRCQFLENRSSAIGGGTLVKLRSDSRSIVELTFVASLLSGAKLDQTGAVNPLSPSELRSTWERVGPKDFPISSEDLLSEESAVQQELAALTDALETQPQNGKLLKQRAILLMRLQQWDQATADWEAMLAQDEHKWGRGLAALTYAMKTDDAAYHRHCSKLISLIDEWEPGATVLAGSVLALRPSAITNYLEVLKYVDEIAARKPGDWWNEHPRLGLFFRAGQYDQVVETVLDFQSRSNQCGSDYRAAQLLWAAMAYHKLERPTKAESHLREAVELIENELPRTGDYLGKFFYIRWIECQIIRREAEELILRKGSSP